MQTSLKLSKPPVVEFVLGIQFSTLTELSSAHYGLFWDIIGREDWITPKDAPAIPDQFELFDGPRWKSHRRVGLTLETGIPVGRFTLKHRSGDRLLQLQPTRLHINWRRTEQFKPSYHSLIDQFLTVFETFGKFVAKEGLGSVSVNQWELTYVDSFPSGEYWMSPKEWSNFLPGIFGALFDADSQGLEIDYRAAEWSFEIVPKRARLHVSARPGRWGSDERDSLLLTTTARGPLESSEADYVKSQFDLGHEKAISFFSAVVAPETMKQWV